MLSRRDGSLYIGQNGYIGYYNTYQDYLSSYRMLYYTNHADLGNQNQTSILKKLSIVVIGGTNQTVAFKWGFDFTGQYFSQILTIPASTIAEYGIAEYGANGSPVAYYSSGIQLQLLVGQATGSGKAVQTGYETEVVGYPVSIQKIEIQAKRGKLV
jgi:hypothetical protein